MQEIKAAKQEEIDRFKAKVVQHEHAMEMVRKLMEKLK
jgi:hypothetical protein